MNPIRWLGWLIPRAEREYILGDLEEIYGNDSRRLGWEILRIGVALRLHGDPPLTAHRLPLTSRGTFVATLFTDLRFALRQLARSPGFSLLAVLTLALGIGATTAIYSVVSPVLFRPLPYPGAERIMTVWERGKDDSESNTGYATFLDVERMSTSFESLAAMSSWQPTLQGNGDPERLSGQRVTQGFFSVLGVRPALGRDFRAEENVRGKHFVAMLSHGLWQRRFGADPSILGRPVTFNGIAYTVVGVLPKTFESLLSPGAQIWAPLAYEPALPWACRTCRHLRAIGRLKEGVTPGAARRELDLISGRMVAEHPTDYSTTGMHVVPLQDRLTREVRPALLAVLGAVALVLLIACANVSALLLGRAIQREGEFAIRGALGAGKGRVMRQLLTESVLLSLLGGMAGVALAYWGVKGLSALAPANLPRLSAIGIDGGVLLFTAAISVASGIAFGLVPAFATARPDLFAALRPGGRATGLRSRRLARATLVTGEIALALMLLFGAGLLMRSLHRLLAVNPGFDPTGLLTMEVQTTGPRYQEDEPVRRFFEQAQEAIRLIPGVEQAGWTSMLPLGGNFDRYGVRIEGVVLANPANAPSADRYAVTPGYLEAMRIPLQRGRTLTAADGTAAPKVVLINQTFAALAWPNSDPIGARLQVGGPDRPFWTVVGIVGDVRHTGLDETQAPQVYLPEAQWFSADNAMVLTARTRGDPAQLAGAIRAAIRAVDPSLPILQVATMEEVVSATAQQRRFAFVLFQVFAVVASLLAAAGIYGVLAGSVTERTRELGIRAALGASRGGIVALVVRQGLALTLTGLAAGALGSLLLSRFLQRLLFGVGSTDPATFGVVVAVLLAVALTACWAPAWRATRVSPLEAIRGE
jgi:putative ABC transport system permease protein